jgi:hypothetical protein
MAWAKLDDQFVEHPRIVPLGDRAFRLHVAAICLSNRKLTDGHISSHDGRILMASVKASRRHTDELVELGVWETNGDGWQIRAYLQWNPTAEYVKERRRKDQERKRGNP